MFFWYEAQKFQPFIVHFDFSYSPVKLEMSNKAIEQYILICHHLFARLLIASTQVHAAAFLAAAVGVGFCTHKQTIKAASRC